MTRFGEVVLEKYIRGRLDLITPINKANDGTAVATAELNINAIIPFGKDPGMPAKQS